jgi:hypothetical protein
MLVRRERDRRKRIARSLEASFAEEKHPPRFETHSGIDPTFIEAAPIAERQPCRTAGARFTAARVLNRGRRRA